ncbi:hypothetical protein MGYG_08225 [Nannizzia gypsea CBS 118893]|uniref:Uncharacterized protein n=1 Tax=Arthroderma gypseum (strain ATCC MYA-4604 / CBS 118893) TaxID=535722 RepID=E4V5D7_ARTGP|nr:hypothetical protein MGYG_08225 [Nannizzia gypsea CBS 118893]EFR05211.1 hypothetical protein MGYG_08225 [Nannizzia gypsea CBS 118893]
MATLYKLAQFGKLTKEDMTNKQIMHGLNAVDPVTKLTPLGVAVWFSHVKTIGLLLKNGANPDGKDPNGTARDVRPPLWVAAAKSKERVGTMMQLLLNAGADPNIVSPFDGDSSPLLKAVQTYKYPPLISALVDKGANPDQANGLGQTPRRIAEDRNDRDTVKALRKRKERSLGRLHWVGVIVSVVVGVVAWVNAFVMVAVVGAGGAVAAAAPYVTQVIKRRFQMSGSFVKNVWPENLKQREPKEEFKKDAKEFIKENKLNEFFPPNDPFLQTVVDKATELEASPDNTLDTKDLARLALYQPVMYCDDSGSMNKDNRAKHQIDIVERIASIATRIIPDDEGVKVRFINRNTDIMIYKRNLDELGPIMGRQSPYGPTEMGTYLRSKVLDPLVYQPLATKSLKRPVLVSIITDGRPEGGREKTDTLKKTILECGKRLEAAGYDRKVVRFQISQIGYDENARDFLESLTREDELLDVLYCTTDRLDEEFAKLQNNEARLEQWLLRLLMGPITNAHQG